MKECFDHIIWNLKLANSKRVQLTKQYIQHLF